jgi:hypothetical protein
MFRERDLYFRKTAVSKTLAADKTLRKDLLFALESARTRLAIAAAFEKRRTMPEIWQYYLETSDQMRRSIRKLRRAEKGDPALKNCVCALEMLQAISAREQAYPLCRALREVIAEIDRDGID